jgi:putative endonuclease
VKLETRAFGLECETLAARFLSDRGYRIVERNYRTRRGEIDLIAYDGHTLVFIEVKARRSDAFGGPRWAIDRRKQVRLGKLAHHYLHRQRLEDQDCRFDLVFIHAEEGKSPAVELMKNAFEVRRDYG